MLNNPNGTSHPVGTGPFVFKEWIPNTHFIATANPHYWRKGLPYLSQITFKPIVTPNSRVAALETGTIDIMHTVTPASIKTFRGNKKWSYFDNSGSLLGQAVVNCLMLNTSKPPFNNKTLRTAMAKATDAAEYSKVVDLGVNAPLYGMYQPGSPYYTKTAYPKPDPKGAAKLVSQIAKQTGQPVSFTLNATNDPIVERAAQFLQQAYQTAGMKVSIDITIAGSDHQHRAGRHLPSRHVAPVRRRDSGPELRVVEHDHRRSAAAAQHGPQLGPSHSGSPDRRSSGQLPRRPRSRPIRKSTSTWLRTSRTFTSTGRPGPWWPIRKCRTSSTRPPRKAPRPTASTRVCSGRRRFGSANASRHRRGIRHASACTALRAGVGNRSD